MSNSVAAPVYRSVTGDASPSVSVRWALVSLSLSMLMPSLDTSIANAALPTLAAAFTATFQQVQWIVLAYLLAITTLIVSAGRLGDMVGRRRLLLAGIVVFTVASVLCGVAPSLLSMLAARGAQGVGAAVMMALSVAFVADTVPTEKTGTAMGLLGTVSAIGTTLGPSLGGVLIVAFGWRSIFLINLPIGIAALVLAYRYLPVDEPRRSQARPRFDVPGTVLLALTLAAYALAMTLGRGHVGPLNAALLAAVACGTGLFIVVERRSLSPVIPVDMFRNQRLSGCLVMSGLVSTVMMATLVVGPFYLSRALGLEAAAVGFVLSVGPLVAALSGVPAGRIVDRLGVLRTTRAGLVGIATAASALALIPPAYGVAGYVAPIVVMTASYAVFQAANNTAIMTDVGSGERGVVAGTLSLARNLGLITGASAMGAIFVRVAGQIDLTIASQDAVAAAMRATFAVAAVLIAGAIAIAARNSRLSVRVEAV